MNKHEKAAAFSSDFLIESVIHDLGGRNLRNLRDHETRWMAERSKEFRKARRERKSAGVWNPVEEGRAA